MRNYIIIVLIWVVVGHSSTKIKTLLKFILLFNLKFNLRV